MNQATAKTNIHSSRCAYIGCGTRSRDGIPGLRFFSIPVNDRDRCITWLVNSGIDDYVELSDSDLKKIKICSRHFSRADFFQSGYMKKTAVPNLYPVADSDEEMTVNDAPQGWEIERGRLLNRIERQKRIISSMKSENSQLRGAMKTKTQTIRRLTNRLKNGFISDLALGKAIAKKVKDFVFAFVMMQIFHKTGDKYTETQKQIALKMHYTSPSLYQKMRDEFNFTLPSYTTIKDWFGKVELWPGISHAMFQHLGMKVSAMSPDERNCVLLFDEVRIKKAFDLHDGKQKIEGFEDLGSFGCSSGVATDALVFMVRGLFHNWKQPVAYYLSAGVVGATKLADILDGILDALFDIGLRVRATVCDQGTQNQSLISAKVSIDDPFFIHRGFKIFCFFDWSHLGKSLRNQLWAHDFLISDSVRVSWSDLEALWNLENDKGTRAAYKLSAKHVYPHCFDRMKCSLAFQVFSRKVSAALFTASATGSIRSETVSATASFFWTLNDLFDNLNSRSANHANPNKCAISDLRPNVEMNIRKQLEACKSWRTITDKGLKTPPCFKGLILSLNAVLKLWGDLKLEGAKFLLTSRLNQDPLENLFSMIRMHGGTYDPNPSSKIFRLSLQKNMVMNLSKPTQTANCADDEDEILIQQEGLNGSGVAESAPRNAASFQKYLADRDGPLDDVDVQKIAIEATDYDTSLESCAIEYFAGYVLKKCTAKSNCQTCISLMIDTSQSLVHDRQLLTFFRAYATQDNVELGHLCVPSDEFSMAFRLMNAVFDHGYPRIRSNYSIQDLLFPLIVQAVHVRFPGWFEHDFCGDHRKELAYFMMKVKIRKDTVWLGEKLRTSKQGGRFKQPQKLRNLQNA